MNKSELLEKAKEMGLEVDEKMTKAQIEEAIEEADVEEAEEAEETEEVEEEVGSFNAVDVMLDKHKVRTYSLEVHGEKFAELAEQFISGREKPKDYHLVKLDLRAGQKCKHCGQMNYDWE